MLAAITDVTTPDTFNWFFNV